MDAGRRTFEGRQPAVAVQAVQLAVTAAVAEAVAPPPPPQDTERTRQLEERVVALTADLKAANDRRATHPGGLNAAPAGCLCWQ